MKANKNTTFIDNIGINNLASGGVGFGELPWATKGESPIGEGVGDIRGNSVYITSTIGARESANGMA